MNRRKLLIRLAALIIFIFLVNSLSYKFYWYQSIWWFDMFMHFLGGFWLSLYLIWFLNPKEINSKIIIRIILGVFVIGIMWEFYEFYVDDTLAKNGISSLDSTSDMFFDLAGGLTAIVYFMKRFMTVSINKV